MRKKLPAYGAALADQRRRGIVPLCVHVIWGFKWRASPPCGVSVVDRFVEGAHPVLCVKPPDFEPGKFEWSVVAGVRVAVFDQEGAAAWYENPDHGPARPQFCRFYELLGEIAAFAACVDVHSPVFPKHETAHILAFCQRSRAREAQHNDGWPHWWSAEIQEKNEQRQYNWLCAIGELAERERAAEAVCA